MSKKQYITSLFIISTARVHGEGANTMSESFYVFIPNTHIGVLFIQYMAIITRRLGDVLLMYRVRIAVNTRIGPELAALFPTTARNRPISGTFGNDYIV